MSGRAYAHLRGNVVAYVALFFALAGGTAFALDGSNTVFSDDIVNGEVASPDVKDGSLGAVDIREQSIGTNKLKDNSAASIDIADGSLGAADLADGSVGTAEVVDNSLTGGDINESSLDLASEDWHTVGGLGEPPFNSTPGCTWTNFDGIHNSAAFLRDAAGFVHLKGLVVAVDGGGGDVCDFSIAAHRRIFNLPNGYRASSREVQGTVSNNHFARINVEGQLGAGGQDAGDVSIDPTVPNSDAEGFVSLDGITFRCAAPAGCP